MAKTRLTLKPDGKHIPKEQIAARDKLMPYALDCIPISIACAAEGLDYKKWTEWEERYPALRQELKKAAASRLVIWHREAVKGEFGWQSKFTALERLANDHYGRSQSGAAKPKASTLARAVSGRKK